MSLYPVFITKKRKSSYFCAEYTVLPKNNNSYTYQDVLYMQYRLEIPLRFVPPSAKSKAVYLVAVSMYKKLNVDYGLRTTDYGLRIGSE